MIELHFAPFPPPPDAALKLPGIKEWYLAMKQKSERDEAMMYRLVNNLSISRTPNSS